MSDNQIGDGKLERYRTGYLKMRSVLHDRATGLPAFPLLFDRLRGHLEERREIGVLHLEITNLDLVESLYGWQVFDRIVARVAGLLRGGLGHELPPGALLALNGVAGDRFVLFLPDDGNGNEPGREYLSKLGDQICRRLDAAFQEEDFVGLGPRLTFRSGGSLLSANPFQRFERTVYSAVEQARSGPARRDEKRELSWGEELHQIIHTSAVDAVFQPIVDLGTGEILGYEAFVRGPRDTLFEAPRAMFALSGRVGVSRELDRMCCELVLGDVAVGDADGKLFLNVLASSLDAADWRTGKLLSLLEGADLRPDELVLEISERAVDLDSGALQSCLACCRAEGFLLSLDDVGTGRMELAAIERARPDYLKLDASLVRGIDGSLVQQDALEALVRLAERIEAAVVAEGVETEAEARVLRQGGARYGQGFLFAAPAALGSRTTDRARSGRSREH